MASRGRCTWLLLAGIIPLAVRLVEATVLPVPNTAPVSDVNAHVVLGPPAMTRTVKMKVLTPTTYHAAPEAGNDQLYRPWDERFKQKEQGLSHNEQVWQEHRYGYVRFKEEAPLHPWAPNSQDREAETNALLVYVGVALGMVLAGFLADLSMDHNTGITEKLEGAVTLILMPWVLGNLWALYIGLKNVSAPDRIPSRPHAGCESAAWYLIVAPVITVAMGWSHTLWFLGVNAKQRLKQHADKAVAAQSPLAALQKVASEMSALEHQIQGSTSGFLAMDRVRIIVLLLDVIVLMWGVWLAYSVESTVCVPEVWWTVTCYTIAMVSIAGVILVGAIGLGLLVSFEDPVADITDSLREVVSHQKAKTRRRMRNVNVAIYGESEEDIQRSLPPSPSNLQSRSPQQPASPPAHQDELASHNFMLDHAEDGQFRIGGARGPSYGACSVATVSPGLALGGNHPAGTTLPPGLLGDPGTLPPGAMRGAAGSRPMEAGGPDPYAVRGPGHRFYDGDAAMY